MKGRTDKGKFLPGHSGSKPKGATNKSSRALKDFISTFLSDNIPLLKKDYIQLSPAQRISIYVKLLDYAVPKLKFIDASIEADLNSNISLQGFLKLSTHERIEALKKIKLYERIEDLS